MMSPELDQFWYSHGEDIDAAFEAAVTAAQLREAAELYKRVRERHSIEWREKKGAENVAR